MIVSLKNSKIAFLLLGFLLGIVMTMVAFRLYDNPSTNQTVDSQIEKIQEPPKQLESNYTSISGRYLMTGTVVWDRGVELASYRDDGSIDYQYPFEGLSSYQPENYDAWIADLECPISSDDVPYELGNTKLEFNCLPEFLPYAKQYFDFFNLANNHSDNSGRAKLATTRQLLEATGIQPFGDPEPSQQNFSCEVVALPIKLWDTSKQSQATRIPAAFCAWHYFYRLPLPGEIEVMEQYAELMPVFAFLHMGAEYSAEADDVQQSLAHQVIDSGADFVIANNPHWVQNTELYKNKLIVYSTGNFIFDQNFNEEVKRSANIVVEVSSDYDQNLEAWLELAPSCITMNDDCLNRAQVAGLQKFDFDIKFDVVAGYLTNHQQSIAPDAIQAGVRERLDWENLPATIKLDNDS